MEELNMMEIALDNEKLKPCPCLCGAVPSLVYERVGYYDERVYYSIHCKKCGIKMDGVPYSPYLANKEAMKFKEKIVEKWNTWILKYNKRSK